MRGRRRWGSSARRRRRARAVRVILVVFGGAAATGALIGAGSTLIPAPTPASAETVSGCSVVDGDTLRCRGERIRLLGIDAPELPGHCRKGRQCAPGDPHAATRSLEGALVGTLIIERVGEDHYGRTLAVIESSHGNLSCWQLRHGHAVYRAEWDNGLRVARSCPGALG